MKHGGVGGLVASDLRHSGPGLVSFLDVAPVASGQRVLESVWDDARFDGELQVEILPSVYELLSVDSDLLQQVLKHPKHRQKDNGLLKPKSHLHKILFPQTHQEYCSILLTLTHACKTQMTIPTLTKININKGNSTLCWLQRELEPTYYSLYCIYTVHYSCGLNIKAHQGLYTC